MVLMIPHTIVGVAVATAVRRQPALALVLAFFSHFVLDAIPHWDPLIGDLKSKNFSGVGKEGRIIIATDFLVALDIGLFFVWRALNQAPLPDPVLATTIFCAALLANLPDGIMTPFVFLGRRWGWLEAYIRFHSLVQTKLPLPWGVLTQVVVAATGLLIALR